MKTKLLKKITVLLALVALSTTRAQTTTFDTGLDGWAVDFGDGTHSTLSHNDAEGTDGAIVLDRITDNANFGIKGTAVVVNIDADVKKGIRIRFKNLTGGTTFRIGGTNGDGTVLKNNSGGNIDLPISGTTDYETAYFDLSSYTLWKGDLTKIWFGVRGSAPDASGQDFFLDEIEFITVPTATYSEFTRDPGFEDEDAVTGLGIGWEPDTKSYGSAGISTDEAHSGTNSMAYTFTDNQAGWWAIDNATAVTYDPGYSAGTMITTTIWVKSSVAREYKVFIGYLLDEIAKGGSQKTVALEDATSWQQLTFSYSIPAEESFTTAKTRISIPTVGSGFVNGNVLYVDDLVTTFTTEVRLSNEVNVLEGLQIYPNPASEIVNISAEAGSRISLSNLAGATVRSLEATSGTSSVSVSDLPSGIYIVTVVSEGKTAVSKLVIK
ncbi:T9SS type A sorting domain-containing protein [Flavicella sediminum]|uniref:T9SS type A sorting domain-containing protein n=1 Tax=Flavicella sediminum TaxID=2585141 RepID=UPI00140C5A4C|nr:T9SS type A sorting domain-containing protein [Flavicella sediminum]